MFAGEKNYVRLIPPPARATVSGNGVRVTVATYSINLQYQPIISTYSINL